MSRQLRCCCNSRANLTPRSKLKAVEKELLDDGWTKVRDEVEAKLVPIPPNGTETYVLCRSTARREKERAIRRRFSTRIERALKNLTQQVEQGQLKDRSKIERRLGKIQARHPQVADFYTMSLTEREGRLAVHWKLIEERRARRAKAPRDLWKPGYSVRGSMARRSAAARKV